MIRLTKINGEDILVNINQIQTIEMIPESKILFVNKEFLLVKEDTQTIIDKIVDFNAKVYGHHRTLLVEHTD
ncbi:MAG: flagellar FlbD family protein [Oscillospiraceae bacterium]|nr:flagellar FlbD family protein [Oscillospiraceae bacterium]